MAGYTGRMMSDPMVARLTAAWLLVVGLAPVMPGCSKTRAWNDREVDHSLVRIDTGTMNLRTDQVGHDQWESRATFVLVDANNDHSQDLMVTLRGEFLDPGGAVVGKSTTYSLRVPAGGVRTFALVDDRQAPRPTATSVRIEVLGAYAPDYPPPVQVTDGRVYRDGNRVVANAMIHNTAERPVYAIVLAGFYDQDGKALTRPFTPMYLPGAGKHPAEFVGPPGSVRGYIFIGDLKY